MNANYRVTASDSGQIAARLDESGDQMVHLLVEYVLSLTATGHNPPVPPRPNLDIFRKVSDGMEAVKAIIRVLDPPPPPSPEQR